MRQVRYGLPAVVLIDAPIMMGWSKGIALQSSLPSRFIFPSRFEIASDRIDLAKWTLRRNHRDRSQALQLRFAQCVA